MMQPAKSQEPSMEEILASIRRIIADDDAVKSVQRAPEAPKLEPLPAPPPAPPSYSPPPPTPPHPQFQAESPSAAEELMPSNTAAAVAEQSSDILDLTESMAATMPQQPAAPPPPTSAPNPVPQFRTIDGSSDLGFDEATERPAPQGKAERVRLISNQTSAAVDSAFNALAQTVLVQNARTLEDLVREMLRPMLKSWLDDNLPGMVERLVRAEIERVSRGRVSRDDS
jgi:cell pole-organizing protein PopZ